MLARKKEVRVGMSIIEKGNLVRCVLTIALLMVPSPAAGLTTVAGLVLLLGLFAVDGVRLGVSLVRRVWRGAGARGSACGGRGR